LRGRCLLRIDAVDDAAKSFEGRIRTGLAGLGLLNGLSLAQVSDVTVAEGVVLEGLDDVRAADAHEGGRLKGEGR
jgi:hypothetical protein